MITALQAVHGLNALRDLENQPLPFGSACVVYKAIEELKPVAEAYAKAEIGIVSDAAAKGTDGKPKIEDGRFTVAPEKAQEYARRRRELDEEPVEWKRRKLDGLDGVMITPAQLASLAALFDLEGV